MTAPKPVASAGSLYAEHVNPQWVRLLVLVMRLFGDHRILTQICGNQFLVLKVAPPLVVTEKQVGEFVTAVRAVVELAHSSALFWSEALGMARRAANI